MKDFKETLYEALLFSFGKILAKYNVFAQDSILKDVGKEIIAYLNEQGFTFEEYGKKLVLHSKMFDVLNKTAFSQEEIVDTKTEQDNGFDPLVIENARLYELAARRAEELEKALNEIKKLRKLLPICSHCKKIRDDKGYWNQLETYLHDHSEFDFTHGICPDCMKEFYPDLLSENKDTA